MDGEQGAPHCVLDRSSPNGDNAKATHLGRAQSPVPRTWPSPFLLVADRGEDAPAAGDGRRHRDDLDTVMGEGFGMGLGRASRTLRLRLAYSVPEGAPL